MNMLEYGLVLAAQTAQTAQTVVNTVPVVQTSSALNVTVLLQTVLYAVVGILLLFLGYKIFDWLTPTDAQKKIFQERNTAVAILFGFFILGLSIVIAAAIHGW